MTFYSVDLRTIFSSQILFQGSVRDRPSEPPESASTSLFALVEQVILTLQGKDLVKEYLSTTFHGYLKGNKNRSTAQFLNTFPIEAIKIHHFKLKL